MVGQPLLLTALTTNPVLRVEAYLIAEDEQQRPLPLKFDHFQMADEVRRDWEQQNGKSYDPEAAALEIARSLLSAHLQGVDFRRYQAGPRLGPVDEVLDESQDNPESQLRSLHRRLNLSEILLQIQRLTADDELRELLGIIGRQPRGLLVD